MPSETFSAIDKKMWYASRAFIRHHGPVAMHLSSFDAAVNELIPGIIEDKGTLTVVHNNKTHRVTFSNVHYQRPSHKEVNEDIIKTTPKLCTDRKMSYTASMYVDITYEGPEDQTNVYKKKYIGEIPVMVKSELCNLYHISNDKKKLAALHEDVLDDGGYFIIKGSSKVLVPQVRPAHNLIHTYLGKGTARPGMPKFSLYSETRSGSSSSHTTTTKVGIIAKSGLIHVEVPYIDTAAIPLGIVFSAFGVTEMADIANYIFPPEWIAAPPSPAHKKMVMMLVKSLEQSFLCDSQEVALNYIGRRGKKFAQKKLDGDMEEEASDASVSYASYLLSNEFLPHIGAGQEFSAAKCAFLGYMTQKLLLTYAELRPVSDRDHFALKRIHTSGMLLANQFSVAFRQLINRITTLIEKDAQNRIPINVASYITAPYIISSSLSSALSCNKWGSRGQTQGISQTLDAFNRCAQLCFLRKFIIPMSNEGGKIEAPRHVQGSQWRISCPYSTPEGKKVGLVQGFAMAGYVTAGCDPEPAIQFLDDMDIVSMDEIENPSDFLRYTRIFINGAPRGYTHYPNEIVNQLRDLRRNSSLHLEVSVAFDTKDNEIRIATDPGRSASAVAIAPRGQLRLTEKILDEISEGLWDTDTSSSWTNLVERGFVEILSKDEEEEMIVAIYPSDLEHMQPSKRIQYTHCELSPDMIEGAGVSTSPHNHRNQAPRNIYQEAMSHQAIGIHANSQFGRRGKWHVMDYPQKPIVSTRISRELGFDTMGMGQNAMVAIIPWYGMNQEDSIIMSEASINRGFMNSTTYIAYNGTLSMIQAPNVERYESFEIPSPEDCNDFKGYAGKLIKDEHYVYVPKGTVVQKDDILIGMVVTGTPENNIFSKKKTNVSVRYDQKWPGTVHSVQFGFDGDGYRYIHLVVAQKRKPIMGDKFAARHGQKGTVGAILPPEEMPFLKDEGYTPDILVNPLAFPSRMTIGMLIEAIVGVALTGSALKCPEYNAPLCLDGQERKGCTTTDDWVAKSEYVPGFDPKKDYDTELDGDGTPWDKSFSLQRVFDAIKKMGINEFSERTVINPKTGKELPTLIFNSVVYYQRLKHMVVDKIHGRARGTIHALHRQPAEGRKKGGGFRIGHMERDCMLGQGLPDMTADRLFHQSDAYRLPVCTICGLQAIDVEGRLECRVCNTSECCMVPIPFGTKLMNQEFSAMNLVPRLITH